MTIIYTDGSVTKNPGGRGGFACIVMRDGQRQAVIHGGEPVSTNNRMEILAAIVGLESIGPPTKVQVVTDSQYLVKSMTNGSVEKKQRRNWSRGGKLEANADLWQRLTALCVKHDVSWAWVRGHKGHAENELCHSLAATASKGDHIAQWSAIIEVI